MCHSHGEVSIWFEFYSTLDPGMGCHYPQEEMTSEKVVAELVPSDFTPGLSFVAVSQVKTLSGLAFQSWFEAAWFQKVQETHSMQMLKDDDEQHSRLGFQLNTYGVDLSEYVFFN